MKMKNLFLIVGLMIFIINDVLTNSLFSIGENWFDYFIYGPDLIKDTETLVMQQGFEFEKHTITTSDGYIIELHRIPGTIGSGRGMPVLLHHGCFGSSALWVLNMASQSLGFVLSNKESDVWLSNVRGNTYGRRHTTLDPNKKEFWQFSWDQMALIDLPAMIDYVLKTTGGSKINIIAHSLGAAQAFALLSTNNTYNDKVSQLYTLAPEVNFTNVRSYFANLFAWVHPMEQNLFEAIQTYEIDIKKIIHEKTLGIVSKTLSTLIANYAALSIFGINFNEMNSTRYPLIASHLLSGTSLYVVGQLLQVIKTNRFGRFDWGKKKNNILYGQNTPPDYDISKVKVPVIIYYAESDNVVSVSSIEYLEKTLPNVQRKAAYGKKWTDHLDFLTSTKAAEYYPKEQNWSK